MASPLPDVKLPTSMGKLAEFIDQNPERSVVDIIDPYVKYEARLRQLYAQNPDHGLVKDPYANVLPLFAEDAPIIKARARDLTSESKQEQDRYIMALPKWKRRETGSPAVVSSLKKFQDNFAIFSELSLADINWSNIVAAGSSVVNCLLPVPEKYKSSKRALRQYYHEKFCPASDVDLFLYDLTEEEAIEKIEQIENRIRDSILTEVTTVRTKNAITICSQYPTRHVQIVLRIYRNVSEILTGFDIDCSGAAYDGNQVYVTPRALASYVTQINHVDLTRRSPSYENRLSKYRHRNFEVLWPELERSRIDPTIFERSFQRTVGLARLLVLEQLPTTNARDKYRDTRRKERGRPVKLSHYNHRRHGNLKESHEDEVAEWVTEDEVSNYNTFTLPYGPQYHAKKIETLCYTRDLLLNAEWNRPKDRKVCLHRHPAFFGRFRDIITDCCGSCPVPNTPEEVEIADQESKTYISGIVTFMKDDPGRQQIGSFNPLTDDDWTAMAYVENTTRLCQAIVDGDLESVKQWFSQDGADPNRRDHTGRSPLHLAAMSSTKEIVQCLVDNGARLVARLADGRTALHLAAHRGDADIVKIIMDKSMANEEKEKADKQREEKDTETPGKNQKQSEDSNAEGSDTQAESDGELIDAEDSDSDSHHSMATGSFVNVKNGANGPGHDDIAPDSKDEPDYYDVDVVAWDMPMSALQLAVLSGHASVVKLLCDGYGADHILPVKVPSEYTTNPSNTLTVLTLVLAMALPKKQAMEMAETLISLGASCSQADLHGVTALHRYIFGAAVELVENLLEKDPIGAKASLNHLAMRAQENSYYYRRSPCVSPLVSAIAAENKTVVLKLLEAGADPEVTFESWLAAAKGTSSTQNNRLNNDIESNKNHYQECTVQPLIRAIQSDDPSIAIELLKRGANANISMRSSSSPLDLIRKRIKALAMYTDTNTIPPPPVKDFGMEEYLDQFTKGTYQHTLVSWGIEDSKTRDDKLAEDYEKRLKREDLPGEANKRAAIKLCMGRLEELEALMISQGAKTFAELHPEIFPERVSCHPDVELRARGSFTYEFKFRCRDLTDARVKGYIQLFEACWAGDLDKIQSLTLKPWGDSGQKERPLEIAICDSRSNNPFTLAFHRGHYNVARAVLEIAQAQYCPKDQETKHYTMESNNESDAESDVSSNDEPRIVGRTVTHKLTIENVGEVSMDVRSQTRPLCLLQWKFPMVEFKGENMPVDPPPGHITGTPIEYCFKFNNAQALSFLLDVGAEFASRKLPGDDEKVHAGQFIVEKSEYQAAISSGHSQLLGELIKRTGAGMPLEHLVKASGVEMKEKSHQYYQGLTVYGKKRADWAAAGRNSVAPRQTGDQTTPLLYAASTGCIESVEWYLSDAPRRNYLEWCNSKSASSNSGLKHLRDSGGCEDAIDKWLDADRTQVLHCAVLGPAQEEAEIHKTDELIKYLVKACPEAIDAKSSQGYTPLAIAFRLGRYQFAKTLIEAGADQTAKTEDFDNLLHLICQSSPHAELLGKMMELLDPELRGEMMRQRNALSVAGVTPLHQWITGILPDTYHKVTIKVLEVLLKMKSPSGKELGMLNGAGDTIMHTLVMNHCRHLIAVLAKYDPSLLYRENAVGRTPIEVAEDQYIRHHLSKDVLCSVKFIDSGNYCVGVKANITERPPRFFLENPETGAPSRKIVASKDVTNCEAMWHTIRRCRTQELASPRRLVSLHEANDVANRLAIKYGRLLASSTFKDVEAGDDGDDGENKLERSRTGWRVKRDRCMRTFVGLMMYMQLPKLRNYTQPRPRLSYDSWHRCAECTSSHRKVIWNEDYEEESIDEHWNNFED